MTSSWLDAVEAGDVDPTDVEAMAEYDDEHDRTDAEANWPEGHEDPCGCIPMRRPPTDERERPR